MIAITTVERDYSQESNSDENKPADPLVKKIRSLVADNDKEGKDERKSTTLV